MSVQVKNKKVRVLSAKITHSQTDRQRPFSGIPSQTYTRKQLIQNTYVGQLTQPTRVVSARSHQNRYVSAPIEEEKTQYRQINRQNRQKQQMAEQISALKQTINRLVEELAHQRGKVENMKRKNSKFQKILNMQFQDDKQWSSNKVSNHLVSGIKNMYQNIKQKYELKCKQYETLITTVEATDILEYETYIKVLEEANKQINYKLGTFQTQAIAMTVPSKSQKNASQFVVTQLTLQKEKLSAKFKQTDGKLKKANLSNKDMSLKIQFLEKLIIQKDNNIYALQKKIKKSLSQQQRIKQENQIISKKYSDLQQKYDKERQQLLKIINENQTNSKAALDSLKSEKDYKIGILQANNVYVQQMLAQIRKTNTQLNRQLQQAKYLNSKQTKGDKTEQKETFAINNFTPKEKEDQPNKTNKPTVNHKGERIPQKANKKHSQSAVKKRKIQLNEVLEIAELIRYRLMFQRFSIEKLKKMFDFEGDKSRNSNSAWQQQYTTMKEVQKILKNKPINLSEQDSFLLSRYLIQDVQQEYVYCDQLNENYRQVVKSIIKTLIQQFPPYQGKQIDKKANSVLKDYGNSLKQTLKVVEPTGMITKSKFYDVLKSLGVQAENQVKQYLVAKMAVNSKGINTLIYKKLFDQV